MNNLLKKIKNVFNKQPNEEDMKKYIDNLIYEVETGVSEPGCHYFNYIENMEEKYRQRKYLTEDGYFVIAFIFEIDGIEQEYQPINICIDIFEYYKYLKDEFIRVCDKVKNDTTNKQDIYYVGMKFYHNHQKYILEHNHKIKLCHGSIYELRNIKEYPIVKIFPFYIQAFLNAVEKHNEPLEEGFFSIDQMKKR